MSVPQPLTVLNVHDNEAIRYARTRLLESEGYRVLEAATGSDALHLIQTERPPLVVLDVKLPDISGFDICQQIKEDRATADTCVIQISACYRSSDDRTRGLRYRADSYLREPVPQKEFLATVEVLLALYTQEQELQRLVKEGAVSSEMGERAGPDRRHTPEQRRLVVDQWATVKDREREKLAQSLHDDLAQLLVVARLKLHQHRSGHGKPLVPEIDAILDQCLTYTRSLMSDLMPPELLDGQVNLALRWLAEPMRTHGLTVDVVVPDMAIVLPTDMAMTVVKCVRELLFNVLKHADTQRAIVRMECGDDHIQITVLDHGRGGAQLPSRGSAHHSYGLASVRHRLESVGGRLDIVSSVGAGTRATLVVPYAPLGEPPYR
jgi:signal transduction histidine kinase